MSNLYKFSNLKCDNPGAPQLVPVNKSVISSNGSDYIFRDSLAGSQPGMIDVVNAFQWTTSPPGVQSRQEVPGIFLREKRLRTNAVIAAAAYYLMSGASSAGVLAARGKLAINNLIPGSTSAAGSFLNSLGNVPALNNIGSGALNIFEQKVLNTVATLTTGNSDIRNLLSKDIEGLSSELLRAYEGLYLTEDTKFMYYMPYFDNRMRDLLNNFSEEDSIFHQGTNLMRGVETMRRSAAALARFAYFSEPGIYIERPKFYSFNSSGDLLDVTFPLINTGWSSYEDVRRNWQLVFMLIYQNRPNRRSRELIDPACIYEVNIPGVKYIPFAFMRNIKIDFMGARRNLKLEVPTSTGISTINTIVPDAYNISITLEGLVPESQNFLAAMLTDKQDIVNVVSNDRFNVFGESFSIFNEAFSREEQRLQAP